MKLKHYSLNLFYSVKNKAFISKTCEKHPYFKVATIRELRHTHQKLNELKNIGKQPVCLSACPRSPAVYFSSSFRVFHSLQRLVRVGIAPTFVKMK